MLYIWSEKSPTVKELRANQYKQVIILTVILLPKIICNSTKSPLYMQKEGRKIFVYEVFSLMFVFGAVQE